MIEEVIYRDKKYRRVNGKWVDKNNMAVSQLQQILDNILFQQEYIEKLTVEELIAEADKLKEARSVHLAIKLYETALETQTVEVHRFVLPKLTSCYRAQGRPQKAIELFEKSKSQYGERLLSPPLCTSAAAAYCDIQDYISAKDCADKAYAMGGGKASGELKGVYGRIRKETTGSGKFE